jgi:hypothetical protein
MRISFIVLSLLVSAQCIAATCGDSSTGSNRDVRTVELLKPSEGKSYYFRASHYAFIIPADQLINLLEAKEWGSNARDRLLVELKKDPAVSKTDLFKYALIDGRYLQLIEHLVADLAEAGKVGLIDVWGWNEPERVALTLTVVAISNDGYQGRAFCSQSGDLLLQVTDSVV